MAELSSEAGAFKLSDLLNITKTFLPQRGPELGPSEVVYMEKSEIYRVFFSDKPAFENT